MMNITVNGEPRTVSEGTTIADLLAELGLAGKPVAVEVNRSVVAKRRHDQHTLHDGDTVEMVTLVGGG
jgi:thiamine biosynthesis protein ThiS